MVTLDLTYIGLKEKDRAMVNDVLKVTIVALVMEIFSLQLRGVELSNLFSQPFVNKLLFQTLGFAVFYMIVKNTVDIKLS